MDLEEGGSREVAKPISVTQLRMENACIFWRVMECTLQCHLTLKRQVNFEKLLNSVRVWGSELREEKFIRSSGMFDVPRP